MLTDIRMNTPLATNFSNLQGYSTDIASFRKAISTHNKEAIEKYLAVPKLINETDINAALFLCIENFKIEEQSEDCLCLLLRYTYLNIGTRPTRTAK